MRSGMNHTPARRAARPASDPGFSQMSCQPRKHNNTPDPTDWPPSQRRQQRAPGTQRRQHPHHGPHGGTARRPIPPSRFPSTPRDNAGRGRLSAVRCVWPAPAADGCSCCLQQQATGFLGLVRGCDMPDRFRARTWTHLARQDGHEMDTAKAQCVHHGGHCAARQSEHIQTKTPAAPCLSPTGQDSLRQG